MKWSRILIGVVLVAAIIFLPWVWRKQGAAQVGKERVTSAMRLSQPIAVEGRDTTPAVAVPAPTSPKGTPRVAFTSEPASLAAPLAISDVPPAPPNKLMPPITMGGFWSLPEDQQERLVTGMQAQADWPQETRLFLRAALRDRALSPVTRNNMAVGLLRQEPEIMGLQEDFTLMARDPQEDPVWRDYSLQFLAQLCERVPAPEQDAIVAVLVNAISEGGGTAPGTAVLQLSHLAEAGLVVLDEGFTQRTLALANDPQQMESNRSTALAVLAQRGYAPSLTLARELLVAREAPGIKRAAIGVLNVLGDQADLQVVRGLTLDPDPSVRLVATTAAQALSRRLDGSRAP